MYTLEDFVHQAGIDHLNLFTLVDFFKKSKIGVKVLNNDHNIILHYIYV